MNRNRLLLSAMLVSGVVSTAPAQAGYVPSSMAEAIKSGNYSDQYLAGTKKYLIAWAGDQMLDGKNKSPMDEMFGLRDGTLPDADFLAIIDADPSSPYYGRVVNTAEMPAVYGQHLLSSTENFVDDALEIGLSNTGNDQMITSLTNPLISSYQADDDMLGGVPNFRSAENGLPKVVPAPSSVLNEPHHHSVYPTVDPANGNVYSYYGGLISANVFGCDITDPLNIKPTPGSTRENIPGLHSDVENNICGLSISGASDTALSGTDDLERNPNNGHYFTTMMGAGGQYSDTGVVASSLPPVLTTPGGVLEFDPLTNAVVGEYSAVPQQSVYGHGTYANGAPMLGPQRYAPRLQIRFGGMDANGDCTAGNAPTALEGIDVFNLCVPGVARQNNIGADTAAPDTGMLANPHGIGLRTDLNGKVADANGNVTHKTRGMMMTSDYADPVSLALTDMGGDDPKMAAQRQGSTVRFWDLANPQKGPYQVMQLPDGPRVEMNQIHEEPEGVMAMRMMHKGKGAFAASMSGGALYYTPDVTLAKPEFRLVYDFGPGSGASVFTITQDDKYLFIPIAGIAIDGQAHHDRDYDGQHDRRVAVLDIRRLTRKGTKYKCDASPASAWDNSGPVNQMGDNTTVGPAGRIYKNPSDMHNGTRFWPNNGKNDCPDQIDMVNFSGSGEDGYLGTWDDHADNETSKGGPHFVVHDRNDKYVATSNYFVDLRNFAIKDAGTLMSSLGLEVAWENPNSSWPAGNTAGDDLPPGGMGNMFEELGIPGGVSNALAGTGSVGDDTICMMRWNRGKRNLKLDRRFNSYDGNSPNGCIDLDFGDTGQAWPSRGTRHAEAGNATPHGMSFIRPGINKFFTNGQPVSSSTAGL